MENVSRFFNWSQNDMDIFEYFDPMIIPPVTYITIIYLILILGVIGNSCIFVLMHQQAFRSVSYSVYLRCLAVCDTLVLTTICTEDILDHQFQKLQEFLVIHTLICKIWTYVFVIARFSSCWFVVSLTFDRLVAIVFPLKRPTFCTLKTASILSAALITVLMLYAVPMLFFSDTVEEGGEKLCVYIGGVFMKYYVFVGGLVTATVLPCFLILIFNIYTVSAIIHGYKFRKSFKKPEEPRTARTVGTTICLITVSLMVFCTLTPKATYEIIEMILMAQFEKELLEALAMSNSTDVTEPLPHDIWTILNLIELINFGQNFYIMILTGPRYRNTFFALFTGRRAGHSSWKDKNKQTQRQQDTGTSSLQ